MMTITTGGLKIRKGYDEKNKNREKMRKIIDNVLID